jgi:hypothetical protein
VDVNVEIDELVLDGLAGSANRAAFAARLEDQLSNVPGHLVIAIGQAVADAIDTTMAGRSDPSPP